MSFKLKLFKECSKRYKNNFLKKVYEKTTIISNRNLTLNNNVIDIKFIKINNEKQAKEYLYCFRFENYKLCFLRTWQVEFDATKLLFPIDLIVCDLNWKIVKIHKSLQNNIKIRFSGNYHLFIACQNTIMFYDIEVDDILRPF